MIAAVEKQKFVYVLNRDSAANLTISSPLEAHKSHNIVFTICALDVGFDNPVFAAIELDYADADQASNLILRPLLRLPSPPISKQYYGQTTVTAVTISQATPCTHAAGILL